MGDTINIDTLKYYCFDWDDNLLTMPTMVHLEYNDNGTWVDKKITTTEFTDIKKELSNYYNGVGSKWRFSKNDQHWSYRDFRDYDPNIFLDDAKKAIGAANYGSSWGSFISCLLNGNKFLIITARGHEPETIKTTVRWIVDNYLTIAERNTLINNLKKWNELFSIDTNGWCGVDFVNDYLDNCYYIGISSNWFGNKFGESGNVSDPGLYKRIAIKYFTNIVSEYGDILNMGVSIGFSDDDIDTISSIDDYFKSVLSKEYQIKFTTFLSKDNGIIIKI